MICKHPDAYKDPKTHYPIDLPYTDYVNQYRNIIAASRADLQQDAEKIIEANTPFELRPDEPNPRSGILLVHGLLDCPFQMKDIGLYFQQKGYLVRGILLPGHGTVPGSLLNVTFETWLQAIRFGIESLAKEVDQLYLIGFSTGASLGLYHLLRDNSKVTKMVLLSPAIKIRSVFAFASNWYRLISWAWDRAKWLHIAQENDYTKYQSLAFNAAYQVYRLTGALDKLSKKKTLSTPLLFIISRADSTVSASATIRYFQNHLQPYNEILIYANSLSHQKDPNTIVRSTVYPDLNIYHFSHICLPIKPNNAHYGKNGDYVHASHVEDKNNKKIYTSINKFENIIYTFLFQKKLIKIQRSRLTFNPDFDFMIQKIEKFIKGT